MACVFEEQRSDPRDAERIFEKKCRKMGMMRFRRQITAYGVL